MRRQTNQPVTRLAAIGVAVTLGFAPAVGVAVAHAVSQTPEMVHVVHAASSEELGRLPPAAAVGQAVISRRDGALWRRGEGGWQATPPGPGFQAVNRATGSLFTWTGERWEVLTPGGGVNVCDWGARGDFDCGSRAGTDSTDAIQAACDAAAQAAVYGAVLPLPVRIPAGRYLITRPLNLTTEDGKHTHSGLCIRGDGKETTELMASTGGVLLDFTGSARLSLQDLGITTAFCPNPSTVGILFGRGALPGNMVAIFAYVERVWVRLHSNPAANGGIGTVAVWNFSSEGHGYHNCLFEANLPYCMTRLHVSPGLPGEVRSTFVEFSTGDGCSLLGMVFSGQCALVALDYHRPCLYIAGAGSVDLGNTYMSLRPGPQPQPRGTYLYCVENAGCVGYRHYATMMEGPGSPENIPAGTLDAARMGYGYLRNTLYLEQADTNVYLSFNGAIHRDANGTELTVTPIEQDLWTDFTAGIVDSRIVFSTGMHFRNHPETALRLVECPYAGRARLRNVDLTAACGSGEPQDLVSARLLETGVGLWLHDRASGRSLRR